MEVGEISAMATTTTTTGCSSRSDMTGAKVLNSEHGADINAEGRVLVYGRAKSTNGSQEAANVQDEFTV
jgi:uncharacterized lipoprotein NlpE involved in copper resistance